MVIADKFGLESLYRLSCMFEEEEGESSSSLREMRTRWRAMSFSTAAKAGKSTCDFY